MPITKGTEVKKSKVKVCNRNPKNDYKSPNGMLYAFDVEFENGDKGEYMSKNEDAPKFKEGEVASYKVDVMTSSKNPDWSKNLIKYHSEFERGGSKGGYKPKTPAQRASILFQVIISSLYELANNNHEHVTTDQISALAPKILKIAFLKIKEKKDDNIETLSIEYSSAMKLTFQALSLAAKQGKLKFEDVTPDQVIEQTEKFYNYITHNRFKTDDK